MLKKMILITLIAMALIAYLFLFQLKQSMRLESHIHAFSKENFVDSMTLSDRNRLVAQNQKFELYLDEVTSYIKVVDRRNGQVWLSNPVTPDPWTLDSTKLLTPTAEEKQKATLELSYFNQTGTLVTINNYKMSIHHPESILNAAGMRTFSVKYIDSGVQVLYQIKDLEVDHLYFPKFLPKDVFEEMPEFQLLSTIAYTGYDAERELYEIVRYESMSRLVKSRLYQVFYERLNYTRDQAIEENMLYGYMETFEKAEFEIAIQVMLHDEGIEARILHDSIKEPDDIKIGNISLYPLFGTAVSTLNGNPTSGYLVIPDGSGAVMTFNNGKQVHNPYRKRVYGTDMALLPYKMRETQENIQVPLFGMVKEQSGFAAIITEGDAMAFIHADVSERIDSYNKIHASFNLRETESVTLGSGFNRYGINLWTKQPVRTDFAVLYIFLNAPDNSYVGIANAYRNHLIKQTGFSQKDHTERVIVTAELIGAYDQKAFFLGIPYYNQRALTTFDQAQEMVTQLADLGVYDLQLVYLGLFNGGLTSGLQNRLTVERVLGGKRDFDRFQEAMLASNIALYSQVNVTTTTGYPRALDRYRYTSTRLNGALSRDFSYHYPSRLPYAETPFEQRADDYVINPMYYQAIFEGLSKSYRYDAIAFTHLGSRLAGHYTKNESIYRQDALRIQENLLKQSTYQTLLAQPFAYAWPYLSSITDLPAETTLYSIVDYSIPLLQLILSGWVDYSMASMNMASERSMTYNFLKVLETGSNLKYTLSYQDSKALIETDYNYYMSTHFVNWTEIIQHQVTILNQLGLHKGRLVDHKRLANNVYQVTYSHGLQLIINYNLTQTVVQNRTIPAMGYVVLEG